MPFNISVCGYAFSNVTVSVNGVLGWNITNSYSPAALPQYTSMTGRAILPFWADLYINQNTSQGIYNEFDRSSPSRTLTFEYYTSYYNHSSQYYHFQVLFYENRIGSFTLKYYNITDKGVNAVVGYQCQHSEFGRSFDGLE